jgi:hypothetical protein
MVSVIDNPILYEKVIGIISISILVVKLSCCHGNTDVNKSLRSDLINY